MFQDGFTPLHFAAHNGDVSLVRVLMNHPGVRLDAVTTSQVGDDIRDVTGDDIAIDMWLHYVGHYMRALTSELSGSYHCWKNDRRSSSFAAHKCDSSHHVTDTVGPSRLVMSGQILLDVLSCCTPEYFTSRTNTVRTFCIEIKTRHAAKRHMTNSLRCVCIFCRLLWGYLDLTICCICMSPRELVA